MYLNRHCIVTFHVETEPRWGAVKIVQNPRENIPGGPQTLAALPDHLHGFVVEASVAVVVVDTGKEESIHTQLQRGDV